MVINTAEKYKCLKLVTLHLNHDQSKVSFHSLVKIMDMDGHNLGDCHGHDPSYQSKKYLEIDKEVNC